MSHHALFTWVIANGACASVKTIASTSLLNASYRSVALRVRLSLIGGVTSKAAAWRGCAASASAAISTITALIAAAAPRLISGARPGFCPGFDWMRRSRYFADAIHATPCRDDSASRSGVALGTALRPRSRTHTSLKNWSTCSRSSGATRTRNCCVSSFLSIFVVVEGFVMSQRTFVWFVISFRAASSRASRECAAAAPSTASAHMLASSADWSEAHSPAASATSVITAFIAAAAGGLRSGSRPARCSGCE
mmetsp:Transcript_19084/g.42640  ORF Transcript_19084/g.42640 Transcript_19084/m.42640 type:complete len:251 (+) Transcript_19084:1759-2511(+)